MSSHQEVLREAWLSGRTGCLSGQMQAKAWALREVWNDAGKGKYGMLTYICSKLEKVDGGAPAPASMAEFFAKVDADNDWYPGKSEQERHGPLPAVRGAKRKAVAKSAMAMDRRGQEVTYPALVAANPKALLNPSTGKVVDKKQAYKLLREECFDDENDPADTWKFDVRCSQDALTPETIVLRYEWALWMQEKNHQAAWLFKRLIWTDVCNSILPRSEKRHKEMVQAHRRRKGWGSQKTKRKSRKLQGKKSSLKQNSWDSVRVWWAPILTRGKLHVEMLGSGFPGDRRSGMATLVGKVRAAVNVRCHDDDKPHILFTDRGAGFFATNTGKITPEYKDALAQHSLQAYQGNDASKQPGQLQEAMLHETAVAWIRRREAKARTLTPWTETEEEFGARLRGIVQDINDNCNVDSLCRALPRRLQQIIDAEGDRVGH